MRCSVLLLLLQYIGGGGSAEVVTGKNHFQFNNNVCKHPCGFTGEIFFPLFPCYSGKYCTLIAFEKRLCFHDF